MADKAVINVCTGSYCADHKAKKVVKRLNEAIDEAGEKKRLRIKKCGCMKRCKKGPYVAFPAGDISFEHVRPDDSKRLLKKMLNTL